MSRRSPAVTRPTGALAALGALTALVACGGAPAVRAAGAGAELEVIVVDADGPVAGAEIRQVMIGPVAGSRHQRLARCAAPAPVGGAIASDAAGRAALRRGAGATGLDVRHDGAVAWLPWPATDALVAIELTPAITPRVTIAGAAAGEIRGGFLFDDGHCVPLDRDRDGDGWRPRTPLPRSDVSEGTLVIEAAGHAPVAEPLVDEEVIAIELVPATADDDLDEDADADADTDTDAAAADDDDDRAADDGRADCRPVLVVDAHDRPVAGAAVGFFEEGHGGGFVIADRRGRACLAELHAGGDLMVEAPAAAGGACAGSTSMPVLRRDLAARPLRVRLDVTPLAHVAVRGRVVDAAGTPVAGAYVTVRDVQPQDAAGCSTGGGVSTRTAVDGWFDLPPQPRGDLTLDVLHDWYAEQELTIASDGAARTIVLARGGRWTGRVLDPTGQVIDRCEVFLTLASGRLLTTACGPTGFVLRTLTPGAAKVAVRVEHHRLGAYRTLHRELTITAAAMTDDLAFAAGADIGGRVVDRAGAPIAGARLTALPAGVDELANRFHPDEVMVEADADGRFVFRDLTPGTWRIRGDRRGRGQTTMTIATGAADVTFVVPTP